MTHRVTGCAGQGEYGPEFCPLSVFSATIMGMLKPHDSIAAACRGHENAGSKAGKISNSGSHTEKSMEIILPQTSDIEQPVQPPASAVISSSNSATNATRSSQSSISHSGSAAPVP